jgi:hypothetical protein
LRRLFLFIALFMFLCPMAVQAEPVGVFDGEPINSQPLAVSNTSEIVPVASPSPGGGEALIAKTNQMAGKLHSAASRIIIPLAIIILIVGGFFGIFVKAARSVVVFVIIAAVLIYWSPMLVSAVINWIR